MDIALFGFWGDKNKIVKFVCTLPTVCSSIVTQTKTSMYTESQAVVTKQHVAEKNIHYFYTYISS